jgi:hypothetical protein
MVKIMLKGIVFLISIILLISLVYAGFSIGTPAKSIETSYGPGEDIRGWVNISLNKEPANSLFESSTGEEIELSELLGQNINSAFNYVCSPEDCSSDYAYSDEEVTKSFSLDEGKSKIIGFKIPATGKLITGIPYFSMNVESTSGETVDLPLAIDILNDLQVEWRAHNSTGNFGIKDYGCYLESSGVTDTDISTNMYCEKITIPNAPKLKIGADLTGSGAAKFTISIENTDGTGIKECKADLSGNGKAECSINYPFESGSYFVCIRGDNDASETYRIYYEQKEPCGFSGSFEGTYDYDFKIYGQTEKFAPIGSFVLNDTELKKADSEVKNVESYIEEYLSDKYDNNCSKTCIIPIKFISGTNQQVTLSDAQLKYTTDITPTERNMYDLEEIASKINSSTFQRLYFDEAGFHAPDDYGNHSLTVKFGGETIFSETISVGQLPTITSLTPTTTGIKYPTTFRTVVSWSKNITKYSWDFGDGNSQNTTTNEITYTYNTIGNYELRVRVYDINGKSSSKTFDITVGPVSEIVPTLLEESKANLADIRLQIATFTPFEQRSIDKALDINKTGTTLASLETALSSASSESDYETILGKLLELNIPKSIAKTGTSDEIMFYPITDNIDLSALKEIGGGEYEGSEEEYKLAVLAWEEENMDIRMIFNEFSATYNDEAEPFMKTFTLKTVKKSSDAGSPYLIIRKMDNLIFDKNYSQEEKDGYVYIVLSDSEKSISFSTTDDVNFIDLPAFISPKIRELTLGTSLEEFEKNSRKWIVFGIVAAIIILSSAAVWIALRLWYKRKYENYLFKNRNNLYNIMNYIEAEKKKGTKEKDIAVKLKKAGWNSEQLWYALRKYAGKKIV